MTEESLVHFGAFPSTASLNCPTGFQPTMSCFGDLGRWEKCDFLNLPNFTGWSGSKVTETRSETRIYVEKCETRRNSDVDRFLVKSRESMVTGLFHGDGIAANEA